MKGSLARTPEWYKAQMAKIERQKEFLARMSAPKEKKYKYPGKSYRLKSWKDYKKQVWALTKQQPLHELINFELRDFFNWQLDHMVSVTDGYLYDLPVEWVANISNLRIIPFEENTKKGRKSIVEKLQAMINRKAKCEQATRRY